MLAETDLLHIPYTPDLTEGGIAFACRSLACAGDALGDSPLDRLRRIVAGAAVELAFRRCLSGEKVPFDVLAALPFTDPDRYDVTLGGHRCALVSFLISRRTQISLVRRDPGLLLQAPALIPLDHFAAEGHASQDIYLFAFLLALTTPSQESLQRAAAAVKPFYLLHPMPENWANPKLWLPLEKLALKSECEQPITIEIGGEDAGRNFVTAALQLPPRKRVVVEQAFHSLAYVHASRPPEARIGLHSSVRSGVHLIQAHEWGNLWIYGMDILLAGYLTHEEFRRKAHVLPAGSRTFQYDRTHLKNLAVPITELDPLGELFERLRTWDAGKARDMIVTAQSRKCH